LKTVLVSTDRTYACPPKAGAPLSRRIDHMGHPPVQAVVVTTFHCPGVIDRELTTKQDRLASLCLRFRKGS
ncbi:hypothetical protein, partial [Mesorhizobium sp. BHbdii]